MKLTSKWMAVLLACALIAPTLAIAGAKKYQVTGKVLEVTDKMVAVQKGEDRWEIDRDANTKITGDLKVGEKVTIEYRMTAITVDVKTDKAEKAAPKAK